VDAVRRRALTTLVVLAGVWSAAACLAASAGARVVGYRGYHVALPPGWRVFRLASHPHTCVRFNRRAVYLGVPGAEQRCPAAEVGRPEAILVSPAGVRVRAPGELVHGRTPARTAAVAPHALAPAATKSMFTGLGFDACSAPSESAMASWLTSSYRAVGVYIGGANMACSQPNLTSTWVSDETAAGWHLIPTYVGLQAPSNSCGCAAIVPARAGTEGTAAATDAIAQAQALGIGGGSPIYFDMESYTPSTTTTAAVLAFLSAWTTQLHADGYVSGVYSSSDSGIKDLTSAFGTSFVEPDELWVANWNNVQSTADQNVPSTEFTPHRRIHQYLGGHNETHGGVTINIDGDYLDGATAGGGVVADLAPALALTPAANGTIGFHASWPGVAGIASWQVLGGPSAASMTPLGAGLRGGTDVVATLHSEFAYFAANALSPTGQVLGTTTPVATPAHLAIYGASAFVGQHGNGGVPVGCFTAASCRVSTTITAAGSVIARTGRELIAAGGARIVQFKLTARGRVKLAAARRRRLAVRVVARDSSGATAASGLNLVPFATSGRGPSRKLSDAPTLRIFGTTAFVFRRTGGGVLAGCFALVPCDVTVSLHAGRSTIATTAPETLGANELGYLRFRLSARGRTLLARAKGNQIGVRASLADSVSGARATGSLALVGYG
jgi:hypothetical protein